MHRSVGMFPFQKKRYLNDLLILRRVRNNIILFKLEINENDHLIQTFGFMQVREVEKILIEYLSVLTER